MYRSFSKTLTKKLSNTFNTLFLQKISQCLLVNVRKSVLKNFTMGPFFINVSICILNRYSRKN